MHQSPAIAGLDIGETNMSAQVMELEKGDLLKVDAIDGMGVKVHDGLVWLTQQDDCIDYLLKRGQGMPLKQGTTVISATQPSLLELYRQDAASLRRSIERRARKQRSRELFAFLARFFS
jgi:hypothetical protein